MFTVNSIRKYFLRNINKHSYHFQQHKAYIIKNAKISEYVDRRVVSVITDSKVRYNLKEISICNLLV